MANTDTANHLDRYLETLKVPKEFDLDNDFKTTEIKEDLNRWKDLSLQVLKHLADSSGASTSSQDPGNAIFLAASFLGIDEWSSEAHKKFALEYLNSHTPLDPSLLSNILKDHIKPLFIATPHPMLNLETGRKLPRPAAGANSTADLYDHQIWKNNIAIANVLLFVIEQISSSELERQWPLVVPPIITLSDDREGKWRLRILPIISKLLQKAPADLLRRTGLQELLNTSLNNTLLFTGNPDSPKLIKAAVPVLLELIEKTTKKGSEARFNQLCAVLGKSIIGSIWVYCTRDLDSIRETYRAIPSIVRFLGIGTVRYLKVILPQLAFHITPQPVETVNYPLVISALEALLEVMKYSQPRMYGWRWTVLDCVCKRWATIQRDPKANGDECKTTKILLRSACRDLEHYCPGIRESEFERIISMDEDTFKQLFEFQEHSETAPQ